MVGNVSVLPFEEMVAVVASVLPVVEIELKGTGAGWLDVLENSSEELVRYPLVGNSEVEETIEPVTALVSPVL